MQSPPIEWALGIGYLAALDIIRDHGDPDDDTLSEVIRALVERCPHGRTVFTAALAFGAVALHRHITAPLKET